MTRLGPALLLLLVALTIAPPSHAGRFTADDRETILISPAFDGGAADGPSRNGAFSQDRQVARYAAFESDATNIVPNDTNAFTDVFVVPRSGRLDLKGGPWRAGPTRMVSRGLRGVPANGPSSRPDLGGDQIHAPRCVAFVSAASNLVRGDRNGRPDAFLHDLRSGRTRIVSLGTAGRQADGTTYEVAVDGACERVAFVSDARNMPGRRGPAGTKQVFLRIVGSSGPNRGLSGRTLLASASTSGHPGNRDSTAIAFSKLGGGGGCSRRCNARAGEAIAFESRASNLAPGDRNARTDVYIRSLRRQGRGLRSRTTLVSATRAGRAGNGPSVEPAIGDNGAYVAFRTEATDLLPGDTNGVADIARVNALEPGRAVWVSRSQAVGAPADRPSARPTITRSGSMVFFESDATNLQSTVRGGYGGNFDRNDTGDIFFWAFVSRNASLQSRDSANEILNNANRRSQGHVPHAAARNPATSYYGNYVLWESAYPLVDLGFAGRVFPGLDAPTAAERSHADPALNQVYLRYIGPA